MLQQSWKAGSGEECEWKLSGPTVSRVHCRVTRTPQGVMVEDLGSTNGTWVNGQRISQAVWVGPQDKISLGHAVPLLLPPELFAAATSPPAGQRSIRMGRASDNDVVLDYPMVSSHHATLHVRGGQLEIEDHQSTNGTSVNVPHQRVQRAVVKEQDVLYLGSLRIPVARLLGGSLKLGEATASTVEFRGKEMTLGRDPACDHVLDYPMISSRHAKLLHKDGRVLVEDLGSVNGTFVNGQRIAAQAEVKTGDVIGLGSYTFQLTADGQLKKRDYRGNLTIEAQGLTIDVPGKRLLDNVSLTFYPSEFVGLMGPSGAGKTTLMNALNGYVPPSSGRVLFNGQDLYLNYAQFSSLLGYVPQDDIIHRDLTVGQALYFTAKLRLPPDTSDTDIRARIAKVLKQLGLESTENVLIGSPEKKGISGGQRKRVNLAQELLTDPSVLFLDEPTSGLSSEDALMVMKVLRDLADSGKTILLTIHQPSLEAYRLMDNLTLVAKDQNSPQPGRLVYYGPAYPDAVDFFNPDGVPGLKPGADPSPDEVLRGLSKRPSAEWAQKYQQSTYNREYVLERASRPLGQALPPHTNTNTKQHYLSQWQTLVQRCLAIKTRDTWNTTILLAQAPVVAMLMVLVFGDDVSVKVNDSNWSDVAKTTAVTIFLLGLSALWFGCSNAVREVVGEWAIYHRERMVNLKIPAYVASKFTVLGGLCVVQCVVLLTIVHWGCGLKSSGFSMFFALLMISLVGIGMGLTLSSVAKTSEVAIALLPIILIPMVILGGVMQPVHRMNSGIQVLSNLVPSRWGFEAMMLLESDEQPLGPSLFGSVSQSNDREDREKSNGRPDMAELYFPDKDRYGAAFSTIILMFILAILVTGIHSILRYRDVH